jgi:hypothetical protein
MSGIRRATQGRALQIDVVSGVGRATRSDVGRATRSGSGRATRSGIGRATRSGVGRATRSGVGRATRSGVGRATRSGSGRATRSGVGRARQGRALRVAVVVALLIGSTGALAAKVDARLAQAESLARKRETAAAADLYRALIKDGVDGAAIRYNLGTLELDEGELGEAVRDLLVAQRFAPNDDDIRHNLDVAKEARTDRLAGEAPSDPIRFVGSHTSPAAARFALAIPLIVLGVLFAAIAFGRKRLAIARALLVVTGVAVVAGAFVWLCRLSVERTDVAVVMRETPALKDPDDSAAVSFPAHPGLYGDVVEDGGAFLRLRFENGLEAWVKSDAVVELLSAPSSSSS